MKETESRFPDSIVLEGMTSISAMISAKEAGINNRPVYEIRFDSERKKKKINEWRFISSKCEELNIPLLTVPESEISAVCTGTTHGGIAAICGERTFPSLNTNIPENGFLCYLEGIEDPYNFGYAIRSLYAAGCDGILLDNRNWMSAAGIVAKSSAGASEAMRIWRQNPVEAILAAKEKSYRVIAAGIRNAVSLYDADLEKPLILIVGGEKRGISASLKELVDTTVRIDYGRNFRGSLSTASATAVIAFEILHKNAIGSVYR